MAQGLIVEECGRTSSATPDVARAHPSALVRTDVPYGPFATYPAQGYSTMGDWWAGVTGTNLDVALPCGPNPLHPDGLLPRAHMRRVPTPPLSPSSSPDCSSDEDSMGPLDTEEDDMVGIIRPLGTCGTCWDPEIPTTTDLSSSTVGLIGRCFPSSAVHRPRRSSPFAREPPAPVVLGTLCTVMGTVVREHHPTLVGIRTDSGDWHVAFPSEVLFLVRTYEIRRRMTCYDDLRQTFRFSEDLSNPNSVVGGRFMILHPKPLHEYAPRAAPWINAAAPWLMVIAPTGSDGNALTGPEVEVNVAVTSLPLDIQGWDWVTPRLEGERPCSERVGSNHGDTPRTAPYYDTDDGVSQTPEHLRPGTPLPSLPPVDVSLNVGGCLVGPTVGSGSLLGTT